VVDEEVVDPTLDDVEIFEEVEIFELEVLVVDFVDGVVTITEVLGGLDEDVGGLELVELEVLEIATDEMVEEEPA
jgi:hypothetical protein